jgi:hypothetical protein
MKDNVQDSESYSNKTLSSVLWQYYIKHFWRLMLVSVQNWWRICNRTPELQSVMNFLEM